MRCKYCHNPETWNLVTDYSRLYADDVSDDEREALEKKIEENTKLLKDKGVKIEARTPEDLLKQALRYKPYWKGQGGITVSGGEALLQMDFLIEFLSLRRRRVSILRSIRPEIHLPEKNRSSQSSMN